MKDTNSSEVMISQAVSWGALCGVLETAFSFLSDVQMCYFRISRRVYVVVLGLFGGGVVGSSYGVGSSVCFVCDGANVVAVRIGGIYV